MESVPNVLADRYASPEMRKIWSPEGRIRLEREFWISVLKAQADLGLSVPEGAVEAYQAHLNEVDLDAIREREQVTRHDVKARLEAFCELAGHQHLHKGLTSRDLTESVEQLQLYRSLLLLRDKSVAVLASFRRAAEHYREWVLTARTHNVPAQPTTLGRRIAMYGEELLLAYRGLVHLLDTYPARGVKGAVGTQLDVLTLFGGDAAKVDAFEGKVLKFLGLPALLTAPGQVYPRSLDQEVIHSLVRLAAGPGDFCRSLRLLAGHDAASEGFAEGQTGSSAMPHKVNSRSCERVNGFQNLLRGYLTMAASISGDQWLEGDVSCSVVRRIALPDACFALDGLFETVLNILSQMSVHREVIESENRKYLPFLCTTTVLMRMVQAGVGREQAHNLIKKHAVAALEAMRRSGAGASNNLMDRLAGDPEVPIDAKELDTILEEASSLTGRAVDQVNTFLTEVDKVTEAHPKAAAYRPMSIL